MDTPPAILTLPEIALEKILSFLTYDEISKLRLVCTKFNHVGENLLSRGFLQVEKRHAVIYKRMKSMLPRRESERRSHPLARHCDILSAVETRLSMLNMTYTKYMESVCCFIPGKVIDEISRILTLVENIDPPPRTHDLLQELRDISSMAMEHFDEIILPRLKQEIERSTFTASPSKSPKLLIVQQVITEEIHKVRKQTKMNKHQLTNIAELLKKFSEKFKRQTKLLREKSLKLRDQERQLQEQAVKIQEQEASIADLKKHVDEWDQKFSDLTAELVRAREDITASKTVAATVTSPHDTSQFIRANIKPRTPLPKYYIPIPNSELERKRKSGTFLDGPFKIPRISSDNIYSKINENITNNISKNITESFNNNKSSIVSEQNNEKKEEEGGSVGLYKSLLGPFISSSIEMILKNPISNIKSRKRKINEDIDLK